MLNLLHKKYKLWGVRTWSNAKKCKRNLWRLPRCWYRNKPKPNFKGRILITNSIGYIFHHKWAPFQIFFLSNMKDFFGFFVDLCSVSIYTSPPSFTPSSPQCVGKHKISWKNNLDKNFLGPLGIPKSDLGFGSWWWSLTLVVHYG